MRRRAPSGRPAPTSARRHVVPEGGRREIDAPPEKVWDALRDFGALVDRRWSLPASQQRGAVFDEVSGTRFVWTTDLLADEEVVELTDQSMGLGIGVVKKTLEAGD